MIDHSFVQWICNGTNYNLTVEVRTVGPRLAFCYHKKVIIQQLVNSNEKIFTFPSIFSTMSDNSIEWSQIKICQRSDDAWKKFNNFNSHAAFQILATEIYGTLSNHRLLHFQSLSNPTNSFSSTGQGKSSNRLSTIGSWRGPWKSTERKMKKRSRPFTVTDGGAGVEEEIWQEIGRR